MAFARSAFVVALRFRRRRGDNRDAPRCHPANLPGPHRAAAGAAAARHHPAVRGARAARPGPGHFPALSRSLEAFPQADRRSGNRLLDLLDRAVRRLHRDADGADPDSGPDRFSAAAVGHGRHSRRRPHPHARIVHDRARRSRHRQRLWRHRLEPRGDGRDPGRADADSGVRRHHAVGEGDAAVRGQSSAGRQSGRLLEPGASVSDRWLSSRC